MSEYIKGFSTNQGIKRVDYNSLVNKPFSKIDFTLNKDTWIVEHHGDSTFYKQIIKNDTITSTDTGFISLIVSETDDIDIQQWDYNKIYTARTLDGEISITFKEKPTIDLNISCLIIKI